MSNGTIICKNCSNEFPVEFAFCPNCGTKSKNNCPKCGLEVNSNFSFCPNCGTAMNNNNSNTLSASSNVRIMEYNEDEIFVVPSDWLDVTREDVTDKSIKQIIFPASVENIGHFAFSDFSKLESVIFEEGSALTEIGDFAFVDCSKLKSITLPASVEKLGYNVFCRCSNLESVNFESNINLTDITEGTFEDCSKLKTIIIPSSVERIGKNTFNGCSKLESVIFEDNSNLTDIDDSAFYNCSKLKSISLPSSVEEIGEFVFDRCSKLKSLTLSPSIEDNIPYNIDQIYKEDSTRGTLILIQYRAKDEEKDCVIIPNGVTVIQKGALSRGIKKLFLPSTLKELHFDDFSTAIYLFSPELNSLDFGLLSKWSSVNLYVLPEYLDRYVAQRDAEEISADSLNIQPMPEEYMYYYENE